MKKLYPILIISICLLGSISLSNCTKNDPLENQSQMLTQPPKEQITKTVQPSTAHPTATVTQTQEPTEFVQNESEKESIAHFSYQIIEKYPHDTNAFTQGLLYHNGYLYESTGRYGQSSLRKIEIDSGEVLQLIRVPEEYFAEGLTLHNDYLIQLTWKEQTGFIYELDSFKEISSFTYPTEGWGLATYQDILIMSDGSNQLHWLDPETFEKIKTLTVIDELGQPIELINELEIVSGNLFANIWKTQTIAILDPETGSLKGWVHLDGLINSFEHSDSIDVLNGIAFDECDQRLFITGKLWPYIFEIKLTQINP